jgi:hypothetical protein
MGCHWQEMCAGVDEPHTQTPIWLVPILNAGQELGTNLQAPIMYSLLQDIRIKLNVRYSPELAYLFCLPRLRVLHLEQIIYDPSRDDEVPRWPIADSTSNLRELRLYSIELPAYIVSGMLGSCKALQDFTCEALEAFTYRDNGVHCNYVIHHDIGGKCVLVKHDHLPSALIDLPVADSIYSSRRYAGKKKTC